MIRLRRPNCPQILLDKAAEWTKRLLDHLAANGDRNLPDGLTRHYRHAQIKGSLMAASFDKCIYCESHVPHVSHGDVEHIKPKSKFRALTFEWANLAFVCAKCNGAKSDKFDAACPVVNPYDEDPAQFLFAVGPLVSGKPSNDRGLVTVLTLDLNRPELIERRAEKVLELGKAFELASRLTGTAQDEMMKEVRRMLEDSAEYSMMAKAVIAVFEQNR